jgi:serine/threonine protein kinase
MEVTRRSAPGCSSAIQMSHRKRLLLLFVLFAFYVIQLATYQRRIHTGSEIDLRALVAVNVMLVVVASVALALGWVLRPYLEFHMHYFNAILCSLCVAWLVLAAPAASQHTVFYTLNVIVMLSLIASDLSVTVWQSLPTHDISSLLAATTTQNPSYGQLGRDEIEERQRARDIEQGLSRTTARLSRQLALRPHRRRDSRDEHERIFTGLVVDTTDRRLCEGFRVNVSLLPQMDSNLRRDLQWTDFQQIQHVVDSSSCHIYTARWESQTVVLKLIKEERLTSPVAVAEFEIEEQVLSRLRHPNVVRLLGSGSLPRKFLVLELLAGGSLAQSLGLRADQVGSHSRPERFSLIDALRLGVSLSRALRYLHHEWSTDVHILHRDIKPDNIGWTSDGTLKLFDFGLCACVRVQREHNESYRLTGNTGTLRYMAPEVVLNRTYNQSVDVYSFAVLFWQVVSGKVPFREMGKKSFFDRVVVGGQRLKLDPKWPPTLSALLRRCWHEDKLQRPSFVDIVSELESLLRQEEELERLRRERLSNRLLRQSLIAFERLQPFFLVFLVLFFILALTIAFETEQLVLGAALAALCVGVMYSQWTSRQTRLQSRPPDLSITGQLGHLEIEEQQLTLNVMMLPLQDTVPNSQ